MQLRDSWLARIKPRLATDLATDCWLWTGATDHGGYGVVSLRVGPGQFPQFKVHRLAYEALVGPIPVGLAIDHLCRVRACANPQHLEPVTTAENNRRAGAARTECKQGHAFDESNTGWRPARSGGARRFCKECHRKSALARYHAKKVLTPKVPKTHCVRGHELVAATVYVDALGKRHCRPCTRERYRTRKAAA